MILFWRKVSILICPWAFRTLKLGTFPMLGCRTQSHKFHSPKKGSKRGFLGTSNLGPIFETELSKHLCQNSIGRIVSRITFHFLEPTFLFVSNEMKLPFTKAIKDILGQKYTSLAIAILGVLIQGSSWIVIFPIGVILHKNETAQPLLGLISFVWFFFPIIGLLGIFSGIRHIKKESVSFFPVIGVLLNFAWLGGLAVACYLFLFLGLTA